MRLSLQRFLRRISVAAIAAAFLYATYLFSMHWGLNALQAQADQRASSAAAALFAPIEKYRYFPRVVATHSETLSALLHPDDPGRIHAVNIYLAELNSSAGSEAVYLIDKTGKTIASSNWAQRDSFIGHNFSFRPYFKDAMHGREGRFYGMGTVSRSPGYYLSYPVIAHREIIGVVAVKINLANLDQDWLTDKEYDVTVTDEYGINFLSSRTDWKYRPFKPLHPDQLRQLKHTRQYDDILRKPLRLEHQSMLGSDARLYRVATLDEKDMIVNSSRYVVGQKKLASSPWEVSVFMRIDATQQRALRHTGIAAAMLAFLLVGGLYWRELRKRSAEREKSRKTIEAAHTELAQRHQQLERLSEELRLKAITDPLGCYNRRFFLEQAEKLVSSANRHKLALSIAIFDVDHFKDINDHYGHPTGDMVLQQIVDICSASMREEDIFARFGGEEFIMVLMHTKADDAFATAERLRAAVAARPHRYKEKSFTVTMSCGVAQYDARDSSIDSTIRRADQALYAAKHDGRNRTVLAPFA